MGRREGPAAFPTPARERRLVAHNCRYVLAQRRAIGQYVRVPRVLVRRCAGIREVRWGDRWAVGLYSLPRSS